MPVPAQPHLLSWDPSNRKGPFSGACPEPWSLSPTPTQWLSELQFLPGPRPSHRRAQVPLCSDSLGPASNPSTLRKPIRQKAALGMKGKVDFFFFN